jgi:hypothetical protein
MIWQSKKEKVNGKILWKIIFHDNGVITTKYSLAACTTMLKYISCCHFGHNAQYLPH